MKSCRRDGWFVDGIGAYALLLEVACDRDAASASTLGAHAKAVLTWLPPFMRGEALRNWAATTAERLATERLAGKRTGETAALLAAEVEDGAMHAMLPTAVRSLNWNASSRAPKPVRG